MTNPSVIGRLDIEKIRTLFPVLHQQVNGKPLIYLDNAATTQKPISVLKALGHYYQSDNANIHRAAHTLAARATEYYEASRHTVKEFIHANEVEECIFTKGTTEGINLVAQSWGRSKLKAGDEVLISGMEHHSNIVPWQLICEEKGATLRVIPLNEAGELVIEEFEKLLSPKTKMVSVVYASNALGTINPVKEIIAKSHAAGAKVLIDGAQATSHLPIDVQDLDCDFFVFSAHKVYGPTGVGVLYGKRELLEEMPPYQGGGEMIKEVTFEQSTWNELPYKFEAGTPNIADVIAFKYALEFVNETGKEKIAAHEKELLLAFTDGLTKFGHTIQLIGTAANKVSVQSFLIKGQHPFDTGMLMDAKGIAVRTGHHCTQPLMKRFGVEGTVRASFAVYNTLDEVKVLLEAVHGLTKQVNK